MPRLKDQGRDRRIVHRRAPHRPFDRNPGLIRGDRARLRRLFERGQGRAARRCGGDAEGARGGERSDRARDGRGGASRVARRSRRQRHRDRWAGRGNGGKAGRARPFRLRADGRAHSRARGAVRRHRPRRRAPGLAQGRAGDAGGRPGGWRSPLSRLRRSSPGEAADEGGLASNRAASPTTSPSERLPSTVRAGRAHRRAARRLARTCERRRRTSPP